MASRTDGELDVRRAARTLVPAIALLLPWELRQLTARRRTTPAGS